MANLGGSSSERIGGVHIDVSAKGAAQAATDVKKVGDAAKETGKSFLGAERAAQGLRSVLTKFVGPIAVFTTFLRLGKEVGEALESADSKAKRFLNTLGNDAQTNVKALDDQIAKLNNELNKVMGGEGVLGIPFFSETPEKIKAQIEQLERSRLAASRQTRAAENSEKERQAKIDGEMAAEEWDKAEREAARARREENRKELDKELEMREAANKRMIDARREQMEDEQRFFYEQQRFWEDFERKQNNLFGGSGLSSSIQEIVTRMNAIDAKLGRIR